MLKHPEYLTSGSGGMQSHIEKQAIRAVYSHTLRLGRCNNSKQVARVSNITPPFIVASGGSVGLVLVEPTDNQRLAQRAFPRPLLKMCCTTGSAANQQLGTSALLGTSIV
jgi:hypothetical protein